LVAVLIYLFIFFVPLFFNIFFFLHFKGIFLCRKEGSDVDVDAGQFQKRCEMIFVFFCLFFFYPLAKRWARDDQFDWPVIADALLNDDERRQ